MGQELAISGADGMTELQARLFQLLVEGVEPEEAKKRAGYADGTPISVALGGKALSDALSAYVDQRLRGDLKLKALQTLVKIMDGTSAQAALGAARTILEHSEEADHGDEKPLTEMSIPELEALIRRKEAELRDVTPHNGA